MDCCKIGCLLGAKLVVFHPGLYGKDKTSALQEIKQGILEIQKIIKSNNWKIKIAPETMGKINVFGSIEEISQLVKETKCEFCLDFAHILAREKQVPYQRIQKLFQQKNWHCHFSGIAYNEKGERHHLTTKKQDWISLLTNLPQDKTVTIINESPTMLEDSVEGLKIWEKMR